MNSKNYKNNMVKLSSYRGISMATLRESSVDIAKQMEESFRNNPKYKDYSSKELTKEMLISIDEESVDIDIDFYVMKQILLDYALENCKSSLEPNSIASIVNIALGSWDGTDISASQSNDIIPLAKNNYCLEAFDTLNKIIRSLNHFKK